LAQLLEKHGLRARVEPPEAVASANTFQLEMSGVAIICLSYLDVSSPAHMRYTIRRLRRRLPQAKIMLGCWLADAEAKAFEEAAKADMVVTKLRDGVRLCLDAARKPATSGVPEQAQAAASETAVHAA
jgi:hypothetical protein